MEIKKAEEKDWVEILEILRETKLIIWFTGGEDYKKFFVVRDKDSGELICCFQFAIENEVGILRSFGVMPKFQKTGLGKRIVDEKIPSLARSLGIKRLYARGNNVGDFKVNGFWEKTVFKHIKNSEIKDDFFKQDTKMAIVTYGPELLYRESAFFLNLE